MAFSCLENGMATNSTTKWLSPAYTMVWPQTRPYKMVFLVNYLGISWAFLSKTILICSSKNGRVEHLHSCSKKNPGPFCRASTLSGTQLQGQFSIAILPCHSFLFNLPKIDKKNVSQFLHVAKPCKTALMADGGELGLGKYFWAKLTPQVASEKQV